MTKVRGLVVCRGRDPGVTPDDPSDVLLGSWYEIDSGSVEIVYKTGVKVVVEGPARYQVDSPNSGILLLGKLRVSRSGKQGTESQGLQPTAGGHVAASRGNPPSRSPNSESGVTLAPRPLLSPLFTVRTRNAILTMQDAELRVWTDKSGETHAQIDRGQVALGLPGYEDGEHEFLGPKGWAHVVGVEINHRTVIFCDGRQPEEEFARRAQRRARVFRAAWTTEKPTARKLTSKQRS